MRVIYDVSRDQSDLFVARTDLVGEGVCGWVLGDGRGVICCRYLNGEQKLARLGSCSYTEFSITNMISLGLHTGASNAD